MRFIIIFTLSLFIGYGLNAQYIFSGTLYNEQGELIVGAHIFSDKKDTKLVTDSTGSFQVSLDAGTYSFHFSAIGHLDENISINVDEDIHLDILLISKAYDLDQILISSIRSDQNAPMAYSNLNQDQIDQNNNGRDIPFLLRNLPSVVATSDAGTGIGYTGIRIRGSDPTRINVTINGVPLNDAESHAVYWVNMPDFASSTNSVQLQRGIGTSTNGAAAFGASVNLSSKEINNEPFASYTGGVGSFNTRKSNVKIGSGLIQNRWAFESRLSAIASDGFIDRASANLKSWYVSGGYYGDKTIIKAIAFSGKERTYQSWYGTPESRIKGDTEAMLAHAANNGYTESQTENLLTSGRRYNYYQYENEVDNYQQDHYQIHYAQEITSAIKYSLAGHYTAGQGYFEQYKIDDDFEDYGLENPSFGFDTLYSADFIRRRQLKNDFYGIIYALDFNSKNIAITLGGGNNIYKGDHFGNLLWSSINSGISKDHQYYFSDATKKDWSNYLKIKFNPFKGLHLLADLQYRKIDYSTAGNNNDLVNFSIDQSFGFFNPKLGISYRMADQGLIYGSWAVGNREPVRDDFIDALSNEAPMSEKMDDFELGYRFSSDFLDLNGNFFFMNYENQLVLTGALNDVGEAIRVNVPESYRRGIEIGFDVKPLPGVHLLGAYSFNRSKIKEFEEIIYDYTNGYDVISIQHENTDISFSPNVILSNQLRYENKGFNVGLISKYVSLQYLDNTQNPNRALSAYFTTDFDISYKSAFWHFKEVMPSLQIINLFNRDFESNGYTYSYVYGETITENFYYPQAGLHFMFNIKFML